MISRLVVNIYNYAHFLDSVLVAVTTQIRVTCMFVLILTGHVIEVRMKTITYLNASKLLIGNRCTHVRMWTDSPTVVNIRAFFVLSRILVRAINRAIHAEDQK